MRKTYHYFTGLILINMGFACCAVDDSQDPILTNHLKIDAIDYELSSGVLQNYGSGGSYEGVNLDLMLFSRNLSISTDGEETLTGSGEIIYFELFTSNSTSLDNGDYTFHNTPPYPIGTFSYGIYAIGWDSDENVEEGIVEITSGTVSVNKKGDEYEITLACKDAEGKDVTGYFKGRLQYYDLTSESEFARVKPNDKP